MISSGAERSDHLSPRFSASAPRALWEDGPWSRGLFPAPDDAQMLSHPFSLCVPDAMATSPWLGKKTEIHSLIVVETGSPKAVTLAKVKMSAWWIL